MNYKKTFSLNKKKISPIKSVMRLIRLHDELNDKNARQEWVREHFGDDSPVDNRTIEEKRLNMRDLYGIVPSEEPRDALQFSKSTK